MDFQSWRCCHDDAKFCPVEGCPKTAFGEPYGCARDHGWKPGDPSPGDPSPAECTGLKPTILPDGSAFFTASFPLPKDHWIYQATADGFTAPPPMPFRMGTSDPRRRLFNDMVRAAAKYAIQASTMRGKDTDFDPDAMVQNFVVGMLGYHTADGLDSESWGNPDPTPPAYPGKP